MPYLTEVIQMESIVGDTNEGFDLEYLVTSFWQFFLTCPFSFLLSYLKSDYSLNEGGGAADLKKVWQFYDNYSGQSAHLMPKPANVIFEIVTFSQVTLHFTFILFNIENLARGKLASQSGSHYSYSMADNAVDGNTNPSMEDRSCVHPGKVHFKEYKS